MRGQEARPSPLRRTRLRIAGTVWLCLILLAYGSIVGPSPASPYPSAAVEAANDAPPGAKLPLASNHSLPYTETINDAFEPITDTVLPGGTYTFTTVQIPADVTVTVTGAVLITVTGDMNVAGTLTGDCFSISLQVMGDITITGMVDNRCSDDTAEPGDLVIYSYGGHMAIGTLDTPAELQTWGNLDISNDPSIELWEFDVLPHQRSATLLPPVCAASADTLLDLVMVVSPTEPFTPTEIAFYGEGADPDGGPVTYQWDFGDGGTSDQRDPWHDYTVSGTYDVVLTVTDDDGQSCQATLRLVLGDTNWHFPSGPAVGAEPADLVVPAGELAYFYSDALDPQWEDLAYRWDLGDGTISAHPHPTHTYSAPGRYTVTLTVTDTEGLASTATASVYVYAVAFDVFLPYLARNASSALAQAPTQAPPNVFNVVRDGGTAPPGRDGKRTLFRGRGAIILGPGTNIKAQDGGDGQNKNRTGGGSVLGEHGGRGGSLYILVAGSLTVRGGARLEAGSGGKGGDATCTSPPTRFAHARGGNGGKASRRLRLKSTQGIHFEGPGQVIVNPGDGGDGGNATATGGTGAARCPRGQNGAKAIAKGGNGGKASKVSIISGQVTGLGNVKIQGGQGGHGGTATATAGSGGSATCTPTATGGTGRPAYATGGEGGDATLSGALGGMIIDPDAFTAGDGGEATATGGSGGDATATADPCEDATATGGRAGLGYAYGGHGGKGRNSGDGGDATAHGGGGGNATATGGDCDQDCVAGGAATATGRDGGDAKARYGRKGGAGAQDGTATANGGTGGDATATGGKGAACNDCPGGDGGNGGPANTHGGDGGDATGNGNNTGGNGGAANATGGTGGKGADCCNPPMTGGDGGDGGSADSYAGRPGSPGGSYGANGVKGGDGGDGGEGEPPGQGGEGGIGTGDPEDIPDGERGEDGPPCPIVCVPPDDPYTGWEPLYPTSGTVVTFTGGVITGTPPITFTWSLGDGTFDAGQVITHIYELPGDYPLLMTATNYCGQASLSDTITVLESCEPVTGTDFTWDPLEPIAGELVTFTGTATGTPPIDYLWEFGDGITATGKTVQHIYEMDGVYPVMLVTRNDCGEEFVSYDVTVLPGCVPPHMSDFVWEPPVPFVGELVTFYGISSGTLPMTFTWDFGDGGFAFGELVEYIYEMPGLFTVTMIVENECGYELVQHELEVLPLIGRTAGYHLARWVAVNAPTARE